MDKSERERLRARAMGAGAVAVVSSDLIALLDDLDAADARVAVVDEYAVDARAIAARCDGRFPATAESARIRAEAAETIAAAIRARGEGGAR